MKSNVEANIKKVEQEKAEEEKNVYDAESGEIKKDDGPKLNSKVIWSSEPNPKYKKTKYDWLFIPLSWFILFAAIFWMVALKTNKILYLFAVILLLFGIYCLFIRNHNKKKKRMKYSYEMTETDLTIILTKKKDLSVRQLPIEKIKYISYSLRRNGVGTIYFNFPNDYKDIFTLIFANSGLGKFDEKIFVFFEIEDAEEFLEKLKAKLPDDQIRIDKI